MKKHFHPLTQENLERVWKAEEKKRKEEERIAQLQQEIQIERQKETFEQQAIESGLKKKKKECVDWMYAGQQTVDTDAYLLGKKIDKNIDAGKEDAQGLSSGASSAPTSNVAAGKFKASDVLAKIKEDPLFLIKKKEEENKSNLMANTVKMRKMKELIEERTSSKRHDKKHKKSKKKKRHSNSSAEDSGGEEMHAKRKKVGRSDSIDYDNRDKHDRYSGHRRDSGKEKVERTSYQYEKYRQEKRQTFRNDRTVRKSDSSSDDEDLEAQRNAMMSNAKWRQSKREKETKKYHKEKAEEEEVVEKMLKKSSKSDEKADFVQKLQRDSFHAKGASVEDRIHRNIHSKQRTNAALDKNFTRR